jgi:hypothetical protein
MEKISYTNDVKNEVVHRVKEVRDILTGLVTSCVRIAL